MLGLYFTNSEQASIINPTIVQPAPCINDMISSHQHQPNQMTQPICSQQPDEDSGLLPSTTRQHQQPDSTTQQKLENDFGNPAKIVTSFLRRLDHINSPTLRQNRSCKDLANFLQTMVDTFTTLGFHHHLHSTTKVQTVLGKLPTPCRLEWNRYNLQQNLRQPSLIDLSV